MNEKYAQLVIPHYGYHAKVRYIRISPTNPTMVKATMGKNDNRYAFPIYAKPWRLSTIYNDENTPPEPLSEWFLVLLHGDGAHFQTFANGAKEIDDWGVTTDIACHQELTKRIDKLSRTREGINLLLASAQEKCNLIQDCLMCARAPKHQRTVSALPRKLCQALPELVDKLPSTRRVMTSALTNQAWPYHFCQELMPAVTYDGGPCMCFDHFG